MTKFGPTNDKRLIRQRIEANARAEGRLPPPRDPEAPNPRSPLAHPGIVDDEEGAAFGEWLGHLAAGRIAVR